MEIWLMESIGTGSSPPPIRWIKSACYVFELSILIITYYSFVQALRPLFIALNKSIIFGQVTT
jgi:hypothetical protein